jgi:tetratricopeptide (TPR) repeat protein
MLSALFSVLTSLLYAADDPLPVGVSRPEIEVLRASVSAAASPPDVARAKLTLADALSRQEPQAGDEASRTEAWTLYEEVIAGAAEPGRSSAINSYGLALLSANEVDRATQVFGRLDPSVVLSAKEPLPDYARYFFNAGESWLKKGDPAAALGRYLISLQADPTFEEPCGRAATIISSTPSALPIEAMDRLIATGNLTCAETLLGKAVTGDPWRPGAPGFDAALRLLARLWTARPPGKPDLDRWNGLVAERGDCDRCEKKVRQLIRLFEDSSYRIVEDQEDLDKVASAWRKPDKGSLEVDSPWYNPEEDLRVFSDLAVRVGHEFALKNSAREALARYVVAWRIHPERLDAAAYAAGIVISSSEKIEDTKRLTVDLANALAIAREAGESRQDWQEVMRLHTVIGDLYAKRGVWVGSESAIYWWQRALLFYGRMSAEQRAQSPVPELYARLGKGFEHVEKYADARRHYLDSAEAYVKVKHWAEAEDVLVQAMEIDGPVAASEVQKIASLRFAILRGDLGMSQLSDAGNRSPAAVQLRLLIVRSEQLMSQQTTVPEHQVRAAASALDLRIDEEVEKRVVESTLDLPVTIFTVRRVVYVFGGFNAEVQGRRLREIASAVPGVKRVVVRLVAVPNPDSTGHER